MERDDRDLAGWHRDPSGRHELRFWDGNAWSEHIIDDGIPGLDFPTRSGQAPAGTATPTPPLPVADAPTRNVTADAELAVEAEPEILDLTAVEAEPEVHAEPQAAEPEAAALEAAQPEAAQPEAAAPEAAAPEAAAPEIRDLTAAVAAASVLTPSSESETTGDAVAPNAPTPPAPAPTRPASPGSARPGARSSRPRPRPNPSAAPIPPSTEVHASTSGETFPPEAPPSPESARQTAPDTGVEPEPIAAHTPGDFTATGTEPTPAPETAPVLESPPPDPTTPSGPPRSATPTRKIADSPTVASPAGNSAGSNTSAIADPHAGAATSRGEAATGPRVAGINPVPVKRYRPGSPPPSPLAGRRALPAPTNPIGTVVPPWYRKASGWLTVVGVGAVVTLVVALIVTLTGNRGSDRISGRPPAAAPQGHKVIDGDGFGIAAPSGWTVATDPANTFPQLRRTNWATALTATDTKTGDALIVVPLRHLSHEPQVDPELFWSDQVKGAGTARSITAGPPLSVHGYRANEITATDPSGKALVAASIDTGDRTFLVAVSGGTVDGAQNEFDQLIQTFDAR